MSKEKGGYDFWVGIGAIAIMGMSCLFFHKGDKWICMSGIAIGTFILSLVCMNYLTNKSKKEPKEITLIRNKIHEIKVEINKLKDESENDKINSLINEIEELITLLESLCEMLKEVDSLICKAITDKLEKEIKELNNATQKKEKLVAIIDTLKVYIDLISTRLLPEDSLLLVEIEKNIKIIEGQIKNLNENPKSIKTDEKIKNKTEDLIKLRDKKIEVLSKEPVGVLDKHEIRRSLTISLTIVYFMLLFFSIFSPVTTTTQVINMTDMIPGNISGNITVGEVTIITADKANITLSNTTTHTAPNLQSPFIEVFTYIYLAVIAFYFGSRAIETYTAMKKK